MMMDGPAGDHENYTPYPEHMVVDITPLAGENETEDKDTQLSLSLKRVKLLNLITNETVEITVPLIAVLIGSKPDLFFLQTNFSLNNIDLKNCSKCEEEHQKIEDESQRQCFLRNHWHYIKSVLGQSIQSCKSRYLNYTEINGNTNTKCIVPDCNKRSDVMEDKMSKLEGSGQCKCDMEDTKSFVCQCQPTNPYSSGIGFGIDPKKPVDGRSNPLAIDKSTHELLNAPKGIYALGPLTADNFVRFIPGGALAIVAHIHKDNKTTAQ